MRRIAYSAFVKIARAPLLRAPRVFSTGAQRCAARRQAFARLTPTAAVLVYLAHLLF